MRKILLWPNPRLKLVSSKVTTLMPHSELRQLAEDMAVTMAGHGGVGLAAIQVDVPLRILTTLTDGVPRVFINPKIIEFIGETELMREGCLSVPGFFEYVRRSPTVTVEFQSLLTDGIGPVEKQRAHGLLAHVIQHEMDHLDGKLHLVDNLSSGVKSNIRGNFLKQKRLGQLRSYV